MEGRRSFGPRPRARAVSGRPGLPRSGGQAERATIMWALLAAIALILAGGVAQAQSADENESGLESCFRAAHAAIAVCSEQPNNPEQRVDCLAKARADHLEVIKQGLSPR